MSGVLKDFLIVVISVLISTFINAASGNHWGTADYGIVSFFFIVVGFIIVAVRKL